MTHPATVSTAILAILAVLTGCTPDSGGAVVAAPPSAPAVTDAPGGQLPAGAVRTIATGLQIPWGLAFLPDGSALVTERGNKVLTRSPNPEGIDDSGVPRILKVTPDGSVTEVQRLAEVDRRLGEGGLLGIAVSPTYATDGWVYIYYTAAADNRIARLHLGERPEPILTGIPHARGDFRTTRAASSPSAPTGCSTRAPARRTTAATSPRTPRTSAARSCGSRPGAGRPPATRSATLQCGAMDIATSRAWHGMATAGCTPPSSARTVTTRSTSSNPEATTAGRIVEGPGTDPRFINPITTWTPTNIASPAGIAVHGDHIYVACLAGKRLYRVSLDGHTVEQLLVGEYGRLRAIATRLTGRYGSLPRTATSPGRSETLPAPTTTGSCASPVTPWRHNLVSRLRRPAATWER